MKRSRLTAFLTWLGLLAVLVASAPSAAQARAASGSRAGTGAGAPAAGTGGSEVTALIAGAGHTCARLGDDTLRCWGDNQYGQLGNGTTVNSSKPVEVRGLPAAPATTVTRAVHNCSILGDGTVQCWGMNKYSQLGDGTYNNSKKPIPVKRLREGIRLLSVGGDHSCVTYQDDTTWCWGQNKYGELGNGELTPGSSRPVQLKGLPSPPVRFAAGVWHTCSVLKDGTTWCWGHNEEGELGNGVKELGSPKPIQVKGLPSTPVKLTAGNFHTCAVVGDGSTWCWGAGKYGQLGNGTTPVLSTPTPVAGLRGSPAHLTAGGYHTCATFADGTMWCWGQNNFGQLGDGTTRNASRPVQVKGVRPNPKLVAGGALHTCAAYAGGTIDCWGMNGLGQVGNGATAPIVPKPVSVVGLPGTVSGNGAASGKREGSAEHGTSIGEVTGIGLAGLAVAGFALFLTARRRRAGR